MGCCGSKAAAQSKAQVAELQNMSFGPQPVFLAVICVHYNPIKFQKRAQLVNDCLDRLRMTRAETSSRNIKLILTVVELTYDGAPSEIRNVEDLRYIHRNVSSHQVMWSKEQLINIAIRDLSNDIQNICWIDSDIEFENDLWVEQSIELLERHKLCFGQPWSLCTMLGPQGEQQRVVQSFAAQHGAGKPYRDFSNRHQEYWHPGFVWIATREALNVTNGLIARTFGSADRHMCMSFLGLAHHTYPPEIDEAYKQQVLEWQKKVQSHKIKLVCLKSAKIRHHWHGSLSRRKYTERWSILIRRIFNPNKHLRWDSDLELFLWASKEVCDIFADAVQQYYEERNEDSDQVHAEDLAVDTYCPLPLELQTTDEATLVGVDNMPVESGGNFASTSTNDPSQDTNMSGELLPSIFLSNGELGGGVASAPTTATEPTIETISWAPTTEVTTDPFSNYA